MALIEGLRQTRLTNERIPEALILSAEADWNQIDEDWDLMVRHGVAFGVEKDGKLVASAVALPHSRSFGWISMVLVTKDWRHKGLATHLLRTCIAELQGRHLTPVLDATPAGRAVYEAIGFEGMFGLQRWQSFGERRRTRDINVPEIQAATPSTAAELAVYDAKIFGANRRFILEHMLRRGGFVGLTVGNPIAGFALVRRGRVATQIGPLVADTPQQATALLAQCLNRLDGPVFLDVPDHQHEIAEMLKDLGFSRQRPFERMALGGALPFGDLGRTFVIAGPELG